jgi:orotate phosphoribosyltransferase
LSGAAVARLLLEAGGVHVSRGQPFVLAAGWASPVYVDCRVLIDDPDRRRQLAGLAFARMKDILPSDAFDAIVGAETAGIPLAVWLADLWGKKLRYVRKRPLGIGHNAQVEGGRVEGLRLLLVDDLTTDGASKLNFARGIRAAGGIVVDVLTIFYHDAFPGADARLHEAGLTLHPLATWRDILADDGPNCLSADDRQAVTSFLADPIAWSTRHGGRGEPPKRTPRPR